MGIFPDLITSDPISGIATTWELKYIKATELRQKIKKNLTLKERYMNTDIRSAHRKTVLSEIKREIVDAKSQAEQYAYASSTIIAQKCRSLKYFLGIFYLDHVTLLVNEYRYQIQDAEEIPPSSWKVYCSNGFFCKEDLVNLNE